MEANQLSILIIYTGGTIGMINDPETGTLKPFNFSKIAHEVPALKKFGYRMYSVAFDPPVDSSDISPDIWVKLAHIISDNYSKYDGFVVLHGTDTMAYSASALSFMLKNLNKPVIFTGAQLPIETLRTDGKENLITAIEIAAAQIGNKALVPEVCIYFENRLYRANRTTKHHAEFFNAFNSYNYPALADVGIHIHYNYNALRKAYDRGALQVEDKLNRYVGILKIFPGITWALVDAFLHTPNLEGIVFESFGSGNAMTDDWFVNSLKSASERGIIMLNVTQCTAGTVDMSKYATGKTLQDAGLLSGYDLTTEAALTKLMHVLGKKISISEKKVLLQTAINGEMTITPQDNLLPRQQATSQ